jgi:hypothetical protein
MRFGIIFLICFYFCLFLSNQAKSQITPSRTAEEQKYFDDLNKKWNAALGTFQIQVVNSRINPQISVEIIEKIEAARSEDEVVYIPVRAQIRIMVLPKKQILKKDFVKISHFEYVSE